MDQVIITWLNKAFQFWIESHWMIALLMSMVVNLWVYIVTAAMLTILVRFLVKEKYGKFIDERPLKMGQHQWEIRYAVVACFIFALGSLFTRVLFDQVWPSSIIHFVFQTLGFILFYEVYSYFIHRLLHSKNLKKYHAIHHKSVRVTPWSAYSVHPIEALAIGLSAPLFMLVIPISLSVVLMLHIFGMMFTLFLHANFKFKSSYGLMQWLNSYPEYHTKHHIYGRSNFGFMGRWLDRVLRTTYVE